ncbi:MAG: hypothetical protein ACJARP_002057 [Vicingaceae bacterium]|jgi:hypothetical protein
MSKFFVKLLWMSLLFISSCNKDEDTIAPSITILDPVENNEFPVLGSVVVRASISDNSIIERVEISLISDDTKNRVLPAVNFQVGAKQYDLDFVFQLSDSLLPTGSYYFRVQAFDGENSSSSFRFVKIRGRNRAKIGVFVTCKTANTSDLYLDQNDFNFTRVFQFGKGYQASVFNRINQHFWFLPANGNQLKVFDPIRNSIVFSSVFNSNFPNPFVSIKSDARDVRISIQDIGIEGFNQNFLDNYTFSSSASTKVGSIEVGEEVNLVEEVNRSGNNRIIRILNRSSGAPLRSTTFSGDIVDMQFIDEKNALVFYNGVNGGKARILNIEIPSVQGELFTSDSIRQVVKANNGDVIISTKSEILVYVPSSNNLTQYLSKSESIIAYDNLNDQLYVGSGTLLNLYNYRQSGSVRNVLLPDEIVGIDIRYNQY